MSGAVPIAGPGRLVLVVGPSGAGKDSLIRAARDRLRGDTFYEFPRRTITRPASPDEDNDAVDHAAFARMAAAGAFAVHWTAHGLRYGISATVDRAIKDGRHVVCNVSRTAVPDLRARYASLLVIEVTAPPEILAARLAGRGRAQDGDMAGRLVRSERLRPIHADITILNVSSLDEACEAFLAAITLGHDRLQVPMSGSLPRRAAIS